MINPLKYHESIKDEKHVFICALSGRSSSTAFQRIVNSSNQVWIWGEPHGILKKLFFLISSAKSWADNKSIKNALNAMYNSYADNKHTEFYANAVGNLESTILLLNSAISNFLKPWAPKVKRFGFKEIDSMSNEMLLYLKNIYPQSIFVFNFRNPVTQWPSICKLNLDVSRDLDTFLAKYHLMATIYMKFAKKHKIKAFIENDDLRDIGKVNKIVTYLNISEIDNSLIDVTIHTIKHKKLSKIDVDKIVNSPAYQDYLQMQKLSQSFYK